MAFQKQSLGIQLFTISSFVMKLED